jgi:hypothetical protein
MPLHACRTLLPCLALLTLFAAAPPLEAELDPVRVPGSLIPGDDSGDSESRGVAVAPNGDVLVIGHSASPDLPVTDSSTNAGELDVWVARFDSRFRELRWMVRLGGSAVDRGAAVAVDASGNVYVTGSTFSSDFPTTLDAFDTSFGGGEFYDDAFVAKLAAANGAVLWSTYLGGSQDEQGTDLALDGAGRVVVVGTTGSFDFPTVAPFASDAYLRDAFVTRFSGDGETVDLSSYYGSVRHESAVAVAIDASTHIYIGVHGRDHEIQLEENHVIKVDGITKALLSDLSLNEISEGNSGPGIRLSDIAVSPSGVVAFAGSVEEGNEQLELVDALQPTPAGGSELFVGKLSLGADSVAWSTYLGGSGSEDDASVALAANGGVWVAGSSESTDYPLRRAYFRYGAALTRLAADGQSLIRSTRFPGGIVELALAEDDIPAITGGGFVGMPITGLLPVPADTYSHSYAALVQPLPTSRFLPRRSFEELPPLERVPEPLWQNTPLDLDGDGVEETLEALAGRHFDPKWGFLELDARGDGTRLTSIYIGELGGAQATGLLDYDGDGEIELVVEDPSRASGTVEGFAIDQNDDDIDLLVVGKGGAVGALFVDLDGDGELEVVVHEPNLSAGASTLQDLGEPGADGDPDVVFAGGIPRALLDLDGDGELEAILERTGTAGTVTTVDLSPADGDPDLVFVVGAFAFGADTDGDGASEAIVAKTGATPGSVAVVAPGVIFVGGLPMAVGDFDGDEEMEVAVQVPSADPDALNFSGIDSDGDADIAFFGGDFRGVVDLDADLEHEIVVEAAGDPGTYLVHDGAEIGADGDTDLVLVYDAVRAAVDVDDDGELELIADGADTPDATFTKADGFEIGADGDADLLFLGGSLSLFADLDRDWEIELAVSQSSVASGAFTKADGGENDADGDADVIFLSAFARAVGDLDGDGELELLAEDGALSSAASAADGLENSADGDRDVVFVAGSIAFVADLDGDGEAELVAQDGNMTAPTVHTFDLGDPAPDGDRDVMVVPGGARWLADLDADGEAEVILQDLEIDAGEVVKVDAAELAADGDADVVFAGGAPRAAADLDGDGELELVLDAEIGAGETEVFRAIEPASDGDADLTFVGGILRAVADLDGDLELEAIFEGDPGGVTSREDGVELGGDGDGDIVFTGGRPQLIADLDGDFEPEVIVEDPARASGSVGSYDGLDLGAADGDPDVVYLLGLIQGAISLVENDELEVVATDAELEGGTVETADLDNGGDGDPEVVLVGQALDMSGVQVPDGGESWLIGSLRYITWSLPGAGNVQIDLSRDGGVTWQVLFGTTPNDGSQAWWIAGPATTQARIRVTHRSTPSYTDISDGNFTIRPASITVTAPNGGGSILIGTQLAITWTTVDLDGGIEVAVSRDAGTTWEIIDATTPNDGEKVWGVTGPPTTQALVRVRSAIDPTISDVSNLTFTIPPASITLTAPNGGQTLLVGSTANITWTSSGLGGQVHVELSRDGGATWEIIAFATPNDGSHLWLVQGAPTTTGLMRVRSTATALMADASNATFTIPPVTLTMTAPNGGQIWNRGSVVNLTWSAVNLAGNVRIEISRDGGASWAILYGTTPNDRVQAWTVTGPITSQLRMRVSSLNLPAISDESDGDSTIPPSTLTVTNPNGGGTYNVGSALSINWSSTGLGGNVEIAISRDGGTSWTLIDTSTGNDGQRTWIVTGPATTQGLMRIRSTSDNAVGDVSNAVFKIQ